MAQARRKSFQDVGRAVAKQKRPLHMMGCMLYWAEGSKEKNQIAFVNSDVNMMKTFVLFLRSELQVRTEEIKVHIHCHTNDAEQIKRIQNYWIDILSLAADAMKTPRIKRGSEYRINRLENGLCTIRVHRTDLLHHIYGAIQEYGGFDNPDWLF
jgi:hypothetical protein